MKTPLGEGTRKYKTSLLFHARNTRPSLLLKLYIKQQQQQQQHCTKLKMITKAA